MEGLYNSERTEHRVKASRKNADKFMKRKGLDQAINLRASRRGTEIKIPYELTLTESLSAFWQVKRSTDNQAGDKFSCCRSVLNVD
jgi:hypothetical protein